MTKINITETVKLSNNHECIFKEIVKISDKKKGGERVIGITKTDGSTVFINQSDIDEGKTLDDHLKDLVDMFINGEKWWEDEDEDEDEEGEGEETTEEEALAEVMKGVEAGLKDAGYEKNGEPVEETSETEETTESEEV